MGEGILPYKGVCVLIMNTNKKRVGGLSKDSHTEILQQEVCNRRHASYLHDRGICELWINETVGTKNMEGGTPT